MIAANRIHSLWIAVLIPVHTIDTMLCLQSVMVPPQFIPFNLNHMTMLVLYSLEPRSPSKEERGVWRI